MSDIRVRVDEAAFERARQVSGSPFPLAEEFLHHMQRIHADDTTEAEYDRMDELVLAFIARHVRKPEPAGEWHKICLGPWDIDEGAAVAYANVVNEAESVAIALLSAWEVASR